MLFFSLKVRAGDRDLRLDNDNFHTVVQDVERVHFHPNYKSVQAYFDVALVQVKQVKK